MADTGAMGWGSHGSPVATLVTLAARHSRIRRNTELWRERLGYKAGLLVRADWPRQSEVSVCS